VLRRLHSLSGVLPVGCFLVLHLWGNAAALRGRDAFFAQKWEAANAPYWVVLEVVLIALPLSYHALYGLVLALKTRSNVMKYSGGSNWAYTFQRLTGLLTLVFIVYHVWHVRWPVLMGRKDARDVFLVLCEELSRATASGLPIIALLYLLGLAAAVYHFATGLTSFCATWGLSRSRAASRRFATIFGILGVLLFALGANTIIYFATGSRLVLSPPPNGAAPPVSCQGVVAARLSSGGSR